MIDKSVNSGTDAQTGFALQRNSALYILLDKYNEKFKNKSYFICLEHHDDFLFCFLNNNEQAEIIEAYQSKKKSPNRWTLNAEMFEIVNKLLGTGVGIVNDTFPRTAEFQHLLFFTSNQTMYFEYGEKKTKRNETIKEDNFLAKFSEFESELQNKIKINVTSDLCDQLEHLHFFWTGLNRTAALQKQLLIGRSTQVFGSTIIDHSAAVDVLINLFREIEEIYNQGNKAKLLDKTKRVSSKKIEEAFKILTTRTKAFDNWRAEANSISVALKIPHHLRDDFEFQFKLAFELFKDPTQSEHRKILNFVKERFAICNSQLLGDTIAELHNLFIKENSSQFESIDLDAIIYAAYFEAVSKK